ncbi:MAG: hypothetical protein II272_07110 [Oscillospiraceae bacterium]|nr:hypothetical protein [Oscillospiraceae bacterium]
MKKKRGGMKKEKEEKNENSWCTSIYYFVNIKISRKQILSLYEVKRFFVKKAQISSHRIFCGRGKKGICRGRGDLIDCDIFLRAIVLWTIREVGKEKGEGEGAQWGGDFSEGILCDVSVYDLGYGCGGKAG